MNDQEIPDGELVIYHKHSDRLATEYAAWPCSHLRE